MPRTTAFTNIKDEDSKARHLFTGLVNNLMAILAITTEVVKIRSLAEKLPEVLSESIILCPYALKSPDRAFLKSIRTLENTPAELIIRGPNPVTITLFLFDFI